MADDWQSDPAGYLGNILGAPVQITSGLRSQQKNAQVGGVPNSAHLSGQAFDFVPKGMDTKTAAAKLAQSGIPFDQIEDGGDHVHISFAPANRKQVISVANVSDDDLLNSLSGPQSKPQANVSDDELLGAVGSSKAPAPTIGTSVRPGSNVIEGAPFGFNDEVTAHVPFAKDFMAGSLSLLDAAADKIQGKNGKSISQGYQDYMKSLNAKQAEYEKNNPVWSDIAEGLGIMASGSPVKSAASAITPTLRGLMAQGAKTGGTLGAIFGAGTPTEGEGPQTIQGRAANTALGAATGFGLGGALPPLALGGAAVGKYVVAGANRLFSSLIPSEDAVAAKRAKAVIDKFSGGNINPNPAQLVPGSNPTLPESVQNAGVSALYRTLRDLNPNSPLVQRETENHLARAAHYESVAGSADDIEKLEEARGNDAAAARAKVFGQPLGANLAPGLHAAQNPVDMAPVNDVISDIANGPDRTRPAVVSAISDVKKSMVNADGTPITDSETLYQSVRKGINDLISGKDLTKGYGATAASQLIKIRDALDDAIETKAPGFKQYLSDYEQASGPIDALKFLQSQNLTDASGKITLAKVQGALNRLEAQQAAPGVKLGKAVTDQQKAALESIRDDLLRAQNTSLGKSIGSNTFQNAVAGNKTGLTSFLPNWVNGLIPEGLGGIMGGGAGYALGGPQGAEIGGLIGDRIGAAVGGARAARNARINALTQSRLEDIMLNPGHYANPPPPITSAATIPNLRQLLTAKRPGIGQATLNHLLIGSLANPNNR